MTDIIDVNNKLKETKEKLNSKYNYLNNTGIVKRLEYMMDKEPYYSANSATKAIHEILLSYSYITLDTWIQRFNGSYYYMDLVIDNNIYVYEYKYSFKKHLEIAYRYWLEDNIKEDSKLVLNYMKLKSLKKAGKNFTSEDEFQSIGNENSFPDEIMRSIFDL